MVLRQQGKQDQGVVELLILQRGSVSKPRCPLAALICDSRWSTRCLWTSASHSWHATHWGLHSSPNCPPSLKAWTPTKHTAWKMQKSWNNMQKQSVGASSPLHQPWDDQICVGVIGVIAYLRISEERRSLSGVFWPWLSRTHPSRDAMFKTCLAQKSKRKKEKKNKKNNVKSYYKHDVLEPSKQALLASHGVMLSSQNFGSKWQRVFTLGDGCWLPPIGSCC